MADEPKRHPGGAHRLDPPERIQELVERHKRHPKRGLRKIAEEYLDEHPEVLAQSRGTRESVVRRLASRLAEALGVPSRRQSQRLLLRNLQNLLFTSALLIGAILGDEDDR